MYDTTFSEFPWLHYFNIKYLFIGRTVGCIVYVTAKIQPVRFSG